MIKVEKIDNKLAITSPYNENFIQRMRKLNGKFDKDTKAWLVDDDLQEQVNKALLVCYNYDATGTMDEITIEYKAADFYDEESGKVKIGGKSTVYRENRGSEVDLIKTAIVKGQFPRRGGSTKYPAVFDKDKERANVILRTKIFDYYYEKLSGEQKAKITVVNELSKKDKLLKEKEALIQRLEEIEKELSEM